MTPRRTRRAALAALLTFALAGQSFAARAQTEDVTLFRIIGPRDEVTVGLTAAELAALGAGPGAERLARKLIADGQLTAWQYVVGRGSDGATRYVATRQVAILRSDTLRVEPYAASLPVNPPPAR